MKSDPDKSPVAADVFTYCTKEKADTWHVVKSHNALGLVDRVICKACGSEHKYRLANKQVSSARKRIVGTAIRKKNTIVPQTKSWEDQWFAAVKEQGGADGEPYSPKRSFQKNNLIHHPQFGKGVVQQVRGSKMDVLFRSGLKKLPVKAKVIEF